MSMKTVKLKSYLEEQKDKQQQEQKQLDLYINGASGECLKNSNTYSSKEEWHYKRELNRLIQIRESYIKSGNKSMVDKIDKEIEEHKKNYINKNKTLIIKELKKNFILLFNSFKSKDR